MTKNLKIGKLLAKVDQLTEEVRTNEATIRKLSQEIETLKQLGIIKNNIS